MIDRFRSGGLGKTIYLRPGQTETQVANLRPLVSPFGQDLRALSLTCDDLRSFWSRSDLHAGQRKFFTVFPPFGHPTQVCTQVQLATTCVHLRCRLARTL